MYQPPRKLKFIGCEIIYREACALAARTPNRVDLQFMRKGLHDLKTADMLALLQQAVDAVEPGVFDAIILGYARCNNGLVGLAARHTPMIIPRVHDCISFFFGGRAAYQSYFDSHPGTYYRTTGWSERDSIEGTGKEGVMSQLGLNQRFEDMVAKYGRENAEFIMQTMGGWTSNYNNLCYIQMNTCDEPELIAAARAEAAEKGWQFDLQPGNWTLLEKLFFGQWDDDFVTIQPGEKIAARNDDRILAAE